MPLYNLSEYDTYIRETLRMNAEITPLSLYLKILLKSVLWTENEDLWLDFHHRLIQSIKDDIAEKVLIASNHYPVLKRLMILNKPLENNQVFYHFFNELYPKHVELLSGVQIPLTKT